MTAIVAAAICFGRFVTDQVNRRLALLHPDVAALRRHLVDGQLIVRAAGNYRRARPIEDDPAG